MASNHGDRGAGSGGRAANSAGCLLVVGGYSENRRDLATAVAAARTRILRSPSLADFFELRVVDMGPRKAAATDDAAGVARLVFELTSRPGEVARNYSALLVIDQSAIAVSEVLRECQASRVISALNVRVRGIARNDDRLPATDRRPWGTGPRTVITPQGDRLTSDDLEREIARYAENLLADFSSGAEQGLSAKRLDELGAVAESRLHSVVKADITATLERRKAELREEAARREAALKQEAERTRQAKRQEAELRESQRDAERVEAGAPAGRDEVSQPTQKPADRQSQPPDEIHPESRGQAQPRAGLMVRVLGRPTPKDDDAGFDADALLLDCRTRLQAKEPKGLRVDLSRLRVYADSAISDEERMHLRNIITEQRLLWPDPRLGDMDAMFYDAMLRLAYGLPLSYEAYCDVEDRLPAASQTRHAQSGLLEAIISGGAETDIRVAAITRYYLGGERLASWFRSGQVNARRLIAALDRYWDRRHHAEVMYDVALAYLLGSRRHDSSRDVATALHEHGYLASTLLRQYPESMDQQVAILMALLKAVCPDGLDRRAVEDIVAASSPTPALRRAVLASLQVRENREWAADVFLKRLRAETGTSPI